MTLPAIRPALAITAAVLSMMTAARAEDHPLGAMLDPHHYSQLIYPPAELEQRKNGTAHIRCTISPTGFPTECETTASQPDFAIAAENLAYSSKFLPAYENGKAVQSTWEYTYTFHTSADLMHPLLDKMHSAPPHYPEAADADSIGARITVICQIDQIGTAHDCTASNGPTILQRASLAYFSLARYYPALKDGQPVSAQYHGNIDWDASHPVDQKGFR
ncbi:energy transducer TonB [Gluconobacter sp. OJB]|uniref:energy transducer TonB n=1 Tax=Gluconobacter sp. OJB TaxID=3145196 RepID=UPI0031F9363A